MWVFTICIYCQCSSWYSRYRQLFPRSQIDIFLRVVQSDGGLLPACINAANLALMDAGPMCFTKTPVSPSRNNRRFPFVSWKRILGIAMKDFVVACSTGHIQRHILTGKSGMALWEMYYWYFTSVPSCWLEIADLNYVEASSGGSELPIALMPRKGEVGSQYFWMK